MRRPGPIRRAFGMGALAAGGVAGAVLWYRRDKLRAEWDGPHR